MTAFSALLYACDGKDSFKIKGTVEGAANEKLLVQRSVNGFWITADTVSTDDGGRYSYKGEASAEPEIFRLERNGKQIYFPAVKDDKLTLDSDTAAFDKNYSLSGTEDAVRMAETDRIVRELSGKPLSDPACRKAKTELTARVLSDPSGIVSFYTVEKLVDGRRLFSPENPEDLKVIGAVATGYQTYHADSPLTKLLEGEYVAGLRLQPRKSAPKDTIRAEQIGILEIELKDAAGKLRRLSESASSGKVVLLNFTSYMAQESPDFNRMLAEIHAKYASRGFEIYQIGYGDNEFDWKDAAKNLPWITVFDPAGLSSQNLIKYNVSTLPCLFIIGRDGTLSERVQDINGVEAAVARYM